MIDRKITKILDVDCLNDNVLLGIEQMVRANFIVPNHPEVSIWLPINKVSTKICCVTEYYNVICTTDDAEFLSSVKYFLDFYKHIYSVDFSAQILDDSYGPMRKVIVRGIKKEILLKLFNDDRAGSTDDCNKDEVPEIDEQDNDGDTFCTKFEIPSSDDAAKSNRRIVEQSMQDEYYDFNRNMILEIEQFIRTVAIVPDSPSFVMWQNKKALKMLYCTTESYDITNDRFMYLVKNILLSYRYIYSIKIGNGALSFRKILVRGIKHDSSQLYQNTIPENAKRNGPLLQDPPDNYYIKKGQESTQEIVDDSDIEIFPDSYGGLTMSEHNTLLSLVDAWKIFAELETMHPSDKEEFMTSIHNCQKILGMRILRREHPNLWPTYSSIGGDSILGDSKK